MELKKIVVIIFLIMILWIIGILIYNKIIVKQNKDSIRNEIEDLGENSVNNQIDNNDSDINIKLIVNNKTFEATLENNETVKQLIVKFPMVLKMSDLHSNEKYAYLDFHLKTKTNMPNKIKAGDIKLYGDNCLVIFYDDFENTYAYTNLGEVKDPEAFLKEIGKGNVTIRIELANEKE